MSTGNTDVVLLDLLPAAGRSSRHFAVTARHGDSVIHHDTIDIDSARSRHRFLQRLAELSRESGVAFDVDVYDRLLMNQAATAASSATARPATSATENFDPAAVLRLAGVEILGEQSDQSILLWVHATRKQWVVKSPAKWLDLEIMQALGTNGCARLARADTHTPADGMITMAQLRQAVALAAADAPRLSQVPIIGQGISRQGNEFLIVNGATAFIYDGQSSRPVSHPRVHQKIIDFDSSKSWAAGLEQAVGAVTQASACQTLMQLQQHLALWNWSHRADPSVAAALVAATVVQACWSWRPIVTVTGSSDVGKSTLLEQLLCPVFGDWTIKGDRSTEAGLRQKIGHDFAPVVVDEFDKYQHRGKVLELFRTTSRGGSVLRGTKDQQGRAYGIKHIPWIAAIESGEVWEQDRNRRIRLELLPPTNRGYLSLPSSSALTALSLQVAASSLWAITAAADLADRIKGVVVAGVHGRFIESFSVPAAMYAVLYHGRGATLEAAEGILRSMVADREASVMQGQPSELQLLQAILAANVSVTVNVGGHWESAQRSIGQLLQELQEGPAHRGAPNETRKLLEAKGIKLYMPRTSSAQQAGANQLGRGGAATPIAGDQRLFVAHDMVKAQLLAGTLFGNDVQIDQILKRLPGAQISQQRCGGGPRVYGVSLPWPACLGPMEAQDNE